MTEYTCLGDCVEGVYVITKGSDKENKTCMFVSSPSKRTNETSMQLQNKEKGVVLSKGSLCLGVVPSKILHRFQMLT